MNIVIVCVALLAELLVFCNGNCFFQNSWKERKELHFFLVSCFMIDFLKAGSAWSGLFCSQIQQRNNYFIVYGFACVAVIFIYIIHQLMNKISFGNPTIPHLKCFLFSLFLLTLIQVTINFFKLRQFVDGGQNWINCSVLLIAKSLGFFIFTVLFSIIIFFIGKCLFIH